MDQNILVSIIIPCYNVEKYVEKCISSICNQTYKNIEVIPVEDGATDNTSTILDRLQLQDKRINVIHKQNAGVSAARNTGIEAAKGKYIVFVDGDDYLAPDYVEYMLSLAVIKDSDFCLSKNCFTEDGEPQVKTNDVQIMSKEEATALLISPRVIVGCWNKMYKREFLLKNDLSFSTSLFYGEGLNFFTRASQLANNVAVGNRKVYYYRRNNEASATSKFNIQKYYNGEKALDKIQNELSIKDKNVYLMLALHKSLFCLGALSQAYAHNLQQNYKDDCKHWRFIIKQNLWKIWVSGNISMYRKVLLTTGFISPKIISKLDMWRRSRIANKSVN